MGIAFSSDILWSCCSLTLRYFSFSWKDLDNLSSFDSQLQISSSTQQLDISVNKSAKN